MDKFVESLNEEKVQERLSLADNQYRFTKVGFDLFRENSTDLVWKTEASDDGQVWLIRSEGLQEPAQKTSHWTTIVSRTGSDITLAYKDRPICRFAGEEFKFSKDDAPNFARFVVRKAESKDFVKRLFALFPESKRKDLVAAYPELEPIIS